MQYFRLFGHYHLCNSRVVVQFVNGMNTSYVQIRNELASEQLIKVQFQVGMSGRYR